MEDRILAAVENGMTSLPVLPEVVARVQQLTASDEYHLPTLAAEIEASPSIAARFLVVANSAFYRGRTPVYTVKEALKRVGVNFAYDLILAIAVEQLFHSANPKTHRFLTETWQHSKEVAGLSQTVTHEFTQHLHPHTAGLAGLLHDIGALPIIAYADEHPELLINEARFKETLHRLCPFIGKTLSEQWGLPEVFVKAIQQEAKSTCGCTQSKPDYHDVVSFADLVSTRKDGSVDSEESTLSRCCHRLGIYRGIGKKAFSVPELYKTLSLRAREKGLTIGLF